MDPEVFWAQDKLSKWLRWDVLKMAVDHLLYRSRYSLLLISQIHIYPFFFRLILTLYSLTAFSNTLVWLSLFTVSDATRVYYSISLSKLTLASIFTTALQVVVAIPVTFMPSRWVLSRAEGKIGPNENYSKVTLKVDGVKVHLGQSWISD